MKSYLHVALLFVATACFSGGQSFAQPTLELQRMASGLSRPVFATHAPGDSSRLFVVEQHTGEIKIMDTDTGIIAPNPFLTIGGIRTGNEQGVLGLAFHPDYQTNGYLFVNYTDSVGTTRIRRYEATSATSADVGTAFDILAISQPQSNHNGGWIGFGPDNHLYIATGDGGGSDDNDTGHTSGSGNSQDITSNLLGKMLRINPNVDEFAVDNSRNYGIPTDNPFASPGVTGDDEIFSYGLRNPYRSSFDRQTGDLYIGDVGQNLAEEIDVVLAGSGGGQNFGWRPREGTFRTPGSSGDDKPAGAIDPIYDYRHGSGDLQGNSVTGGNVYRGPISALDGHYFFGDFINNRLWSLRLDGDALPENFDGTNYYDFIDWTDVLTTDFGTLSNISSFGEDLDGNLYVLDHGGEVFKIVNGTVPLPAELDFDQDGDVDLDDVDYFNGNIGMPASAVPYPGMDVNDDGMITLADHDQYISDYIFNSGGLTTLLGDLNLDGDVDISEIISVQGMLINVGDASALLANLGTTENGLYRNGDLNADGDVDISELSFVNDQFVNIGDASRLLANLGQSAGAATRSSQAVPEPASGVAIGLALLFGWTRRRQ